MSFINTSYLIPLFVLIGAAINGGVSFSQKKVREIFVSVIACGTLALSFIFSVAAVVELSGLDPKFRHITVSCFSWINLGSLNVDVAFLIDPLSAVMMLVVTGVGLLIHIYATGYMRGDPSFARFFSYMNLFCFTMLLLVMADNILLMFVGWEGVGLCSYLLIAFWYEHKPNAVAGIKAFILNRIGDFGFLIGLMLLFWTMYSVGHPTLEFEALKKFSPMIRDLSIAGMPTVTIICLFLFFGATGKSAQIPLYVWLPDAMAGPTPVSALIHAATMVTAGVYMMGRLGFLFAMSPVVLLVVATVGAVTTVFAAVIGFAEDDIKKILAYSTISQLGVMFLGMGTGVYVSGIFHLVTHAFFKACLFLGAGSIILALHHEQDIKRMGGLKALLPKTYWPFLVATLALAGIFPFAGFFSKDEILWQVFLRAGENPAYYVLWVLGIAGAFGTAFYMFRCLWYVFYAKPPKSSDDSRHTPHEYSGAMTYVVITLGGLSLIGGFIGVASSIGNFFNVPNFIAHWLEPVFGAESSEAGNGDMLVYVLMVFSVLVALTGIFAALWLYSKRQDIIAHFCQKYVVLYSSVRSKFYVDEIYDRIFVQSLMWFKDVLGWFDLVIIDACVNLTGLMGVIWADVSGYFDCWFVDGAVNVVADGTIGLGRRVRLMHTGRIQHYFYIALLGLLAVLAWSFAL